MTLTDTTPAAGTYEGQLAARAAELLPDMDTAGRLDLLGVMTPDDMHTSLAWLLAAHPQVFDHSLVRDRTMTERLTEQAEARREAEYLAEDEGYCTVCGANVSWFVGHEGPQHFRGPHKLITGAERRELFDAGHAPAVAWRTAAGQ